MIDRETIARVRSFCHHVRLIDAPDGVNSLHISAILALCDFAEQHTDRPSRAGYYVASRASIPERSAMWRSYRDAGLRINSTWIDEAGEGETADFAELWMRVAREISQSEALLFYAESGDFPQKGALVEIGMALGQRIPVFACLPGVDLESRTMRPVGSWLAHPLVRQIDDLDCLQHMDPPALSDPPCSRCGYNGPGYYQPDQHACAGQPNDPPADLVETVARAICQSRKFECGQGCCAPICMEALGEARRSCAHVVRLHKRLAEHILAALKGRILEPGMVAVPVGDLENSGHALIEGGSIVIRVAVEALPTVVEGAWAAAYMETRFKITNSDEFAADLVTALNDEKEDGTTRIHEMFDAAILYAIEQGAFGIEEHEDQQHD